MTTSHRPATRPAIDEQALEAVVAAQLEATGTPGAAVAIVAEGRLIYAKGFGVASLETGEPVTPEHLFRLGSTTKVFTAAVLAALALDGKLRLDGPIDAVAPGLHPALGRLTAHQLVTHTAGIWDESPMYGSHDEAALAREVSGWGAERLFLEPGAQFSYSNPSYWLAAYVAEQAGGALFADLVRQWLLAPLGMARSTFRPTLALTYPLALGHDGDPARVVRPIANNAAAWAAGSLFSNVVELSRFMLACMDGGRLDGEQALPSALVERLLTPAVPVPVAGLRGATDTHYGYGLDHSRYRGVRLVSHSGGRLGHGSFFAFAPVERVGVVVVANKSSQTLIPVVEAALEQLLGLPPVAEPAVAGFDMQGLAGEYRHGPASTIRISAEGGGLVLHDESGARPLSPVGEGRLSPPLEPGGEPEELGVVRRSDGTVAYLLKDWRVYLPAGA